MNSDILTLHNVPHFPVPTVAQPQGPEWTLLAHDVYWKDQADACAAAVTIDIVGVADRNVFEACFLLMP